MHLEGWVCLHHFYYGEWHLLEWVDHMCISVTWVVLHPPYLKETLCFCTTPAQVPYTCTHSGVLWPRPVATRVYKGGKTCGVTANEASLISVSEAHRSHWDFLKVPSPCSLPMGKWSQRLRAACRHLGEGGVARKSTEVPCLYVSLSLGPGVARLRVRAQRR